MLLLLALLALPVELGLSVGPAIADADEAVVSPLLRARVGVDLFDFLSLNASLAGAVGSEASQTCFSSPCGSASLRAISGFASLRFTGGGDFQGFAELGAGVGHLISLSP